MGYGYNLDAGMPEPHAAALLDCKLQDACQALLPALPWTDTLDDVRVGILLEMAYQLGLAGLLGFSEMLAAIQRKDYAGAALAMRNSLWARQTPARAERLAHLMATGVSGMPEGPVPA